MIDLTQIRGTGVEVIVASIGATLSAQLFKIVWYTLSHGKLNFRIFFHTGGMPSSHSACMTAMATSVGLIDGFSSTSFAVGFALALVVMYDAAGVRRAAGRMAGILNKMTEDFYQHHPDMIPERLRELLGHTPTEVLVGAFWGCALAYGLHLRLSALL